VIANDSVEAPLSERLERWTARLHAIEPALYALWAGLCTLSSAVTFYGYMMKQTRGQWSAPLDDVFIHFDYARATAEGHPFEWVAGNGYSSGNTSLTYPFVLAAGYLVGFTGLRLMLWAAVVAATSTFAMLLAGRRLFVPRAPGTSYDRASSYLLPALFLGVGALDWTLWSGMEVAFFLATWAAALLAYLSLLRARPRDEARRAWILGLLGLVMVVTRPEAVTTVAVFAVGAAVALRRRSKRRAIMVALRAATPGAIAVALQGLVNRILTGEWSAAGAIVKLALYNPFMSREDKWNDYLFNLKYEIFRNVEYHFADKGAFGVILPALALASVAVRRTRGLGLLLLAQMAGWTLLVALNGQVRWQNERYTMPAVAWLLVAAALGASALLRRRERPNALVLFALGALAVQAVVASLAPEARPVAWHVWAISAAAGAGGALLASLWPVRVLGTLGLLALFFVHQAPNMRGQKWFFGRACRNIYDQHVTAGRFLDKIGAHRVLVGDAGALIYASGRKGLDIIGLGGYRTLPFARAGLMGLSATIELMEHVPPSDRPDILAIYPSWWGVLPTWFASTEIARFPAEGNVICGGYEDVLYRPDWQLLGTGEKTRALSRIASIDAGAAVRDQVDVADLLSEAEHDYRFDAPQSGYTDMKILPDPADDQRDMLDGGRMVRPGTRERMRLGKLYPNRRAWLIVRSAPVSSADVVVRVMGLDVETVHFTHSDGWDERVVEIPGERVTKDLALELYNDGPDEFVDYHVWVAQ
jgi:hypothetical protein